MGNSDIAMGGADPAASPPPENPFLFPRGDVDIKVTYQSNKFIGSVSSAALCLASPVWTKFLFPPWEPEEPKDEEGKSAKRKRKEIDCSEDDGEALLLLMNIVHLRFGRVSAKENLEYNELLNLAILCDQYDCVAILQPWLEKWMGKETEQSLVLGQEGWLFIAWVFGREQTFRSLSDHLVRRITLRPNGDVLVGDDTELSEPMPPMILEQIVQAREQAVESLLQILNLCFEYYENTGPQLCKVLSNPDLRKECDIMCDGSTIQHFRRKKLFPPIAPTEYRLSVDALIWNIQHLEITPLPQAKPTTCVHLSRHRKMSGERFSLEHLDSRNEHADCDFPGLRYIVSQASFPNPVLDSHKIHMDLARAKINAQ